MTDSKRTRQATTNKAQLRRMLDRKFPNFPLTIHPSGQFSKKLKGRVYYFGVHADPAAALDRFNAEWPYIIAGKQPPKEATAGGVTVDELVSEFLDYYTDQVEAGERSKSSLTAYVRISNLLTKHLGKNTPVTALTPDSFAKLRKKLASGIAFKTLEGRIVEARAIFNFAVKNGLIDISAQKLFGTRFDKPKPLALMKEKNKRRKYFERSEIKAVLDLACPNLKAMIWLSVSCGFSNIDCGQLMIEDIVNGEWIELQRSKTGIKRRCWLWPETRKALKAVIGKRTTGLVFLTRAGKSWEPSDKVSKVSGLPYHDDAISKAFRKLKVEAGIKVAGLGFNGGRHTFETIGGASKDQVAVNAVLGHKDKSIAANYRGYVQDSRLKDVSQVVREWYVDGKEPQ